MYEVKEPLGMRVCADILTITLLLTVHAAAVAGTEEQPVVTLVDTKKNFSRRPIDQIDIIKEIEVLVTLSGTVYTAATSYR